MSAKAPLGYHYQDEIGWDGYRGSVPIQGPVEEPCLECGNTRREHSLDPNRPSWQRWHPFKSRASLPKSEDLAEALVITEWTCPRCGEDNDVWGEGAVFSWMECAHCRVESYLVMSP